MNTELNQPIVPRPKITFADKDSLKRRPTPICYYVAAVAAVVVLFVGLSLSFNWSDRTLTETPIPAVAAVTVEPETTDSVVVAVVVATPRTVKPIKNRVTEKPATVEAQAPEPQKRIVGINVPLETIVVRIDLGNSISMPPVVNVERAVLAGEPKLKNVTAIGQAVTEIGSRIKAIPENLMAMGGEVINSFKIKPLEQNNYEIN